MKAVGMRRELELAFAHADLALASHYRGLADKAVADKDRTSAASRTNFSLSPDCRYTVQTAWRGEGDLNRR
jgi:hypothetical protein